MELDLLQQSVILFGVALFVAWLFLILRAPSILGFLVTGLIIGPSGLALIAQEQVATFAEIGLVLLLFTVGLQLSPKLLLRSGPRLFIATLIQTTLTAAPVAVLVWWLFGASWGVAMLLGIAATNSSSAILLKVLSDRNEVRTAVGNIGTGMTLLMDAACILLMLVVPLMAAGAEASWTGVAVEFGKGFSVLGIVAIAGYMLLPRIVRQLFYQGGPELLTLFAVLMALGGALVAGLVGWPLALGSCIAGLLLARADLRHQLVAEITPFRDVFNALFFISLGMLVNIDIVVQYIVPLTVAVVAALVLKTLFTAAAIMLNQWPMMTALQVGIGLSTVSEFAYILAREVHRAGGLSDQALELIIPFAVGTMLLGAVLVPLSGPLAGRLANRFGRDTNLAPAESNGEEEEHYAGHVIIVGYGLNGQNLARVLNAVHIKHCVIELDPTLANKARDEGERVFLGDATRMAILQSANLGEARAVVIAINDLMATRRIVAQARALRSNLYILVRTEHVSELDHLYRNGANEVVPADFEVSIEIFAHVLREFRIPTNVIEAQIASVRAGGYGLLRGLPTERMDHVSELLAVLRTTATQTFYIGEKSHVAGKTIAQSNLRGETGVTIIAVVRDGEPTTNPGPDMALRAGDVLVMVGTHAQLDNAQIRLAEKPREHGEDLEGAEQA